MSERPTPATSFQTRLRLSVIAFTLPVLLLIASGTYLAARWSLLSELDAGLHGIARAEVASSTDGPGGRLHVHSDDRGTLAVPRSALLHMQPYQKMARIEDSEGRLVAQTENLREHGLQVDPRLRGLALKGQTVLTDGRRLGERLRIIYFPFQDGHGKRHVDIVAVSKERVLETLSTLGTATGLALVVALLLTAYGAGPLARRLTRPLEAVSAAAREVSSGRLDRRIQVQVSDSELFDVIRALNEMLDRVAAIVLEREKALEAQKRFVADASHELRSPLHSLRGTLEVALRRPRPAAEYEETLMYCLAETERLCRLTNDLLTLARADAAEFPMQFREADLTELALEAVRAAAASADQQEVRLRLELPDRLPASVDPDRIRQVLDNLLANAIRHSPPRGQVTIHAVREPESIRISVADQGPGVPPAMAESVFDRFVRADSDRGRSSGGTGLGLAICRAILRAHHGDLTLDTRGSQGARFVMVLPILGSVTGRNLPREPAAVASASA